MRKSIALAVVSVTATLFVSTTAHAIVANWTDDVPNVNGNWGDTTRWHEGIIPNAQGDTAQYLGGIGSQITTVNVSGGVTVGTLRAAMTTNISWQITPNNSVFLNQDGNGPLRASVINDIQSTGATTNPSIFLNPGSGGTFVLQDDLFISNTSNSTRTNGSVQIRGPIKGAGNITIENITNNIGAGQVQFTNDQSSGLGTGGFAGNIFINKGAVTFTRGDVFTPTPGNIVTIGAVGGSDDVTLAFTGGGLGNMENGFIVAANNTGNLIFASSPTGATPGNVQIKTTNTNASLIRLDSDLSFDNRVTNSIFIIGDRVTGGGMLTKIGAGPMEITNTNTYSGGTVVANGSLKVRHADAFNNGFGFHDATDGTLGSGDVTVESTATKLEIDTALAAIDVIANTATLSLAGGGTLAFADLGYADLGASINEVIGGLILGGVAQTNPGTYGSSLSAATFQNDEYFSGTGLITLAAAGQAGDHNGDGVVDAADYVTWRKGLDPSGGAPAGYDEFFENFGEGGPGGGGSAGVPEPTMLVLLGLIAPFALTMRRRRT